MKPNRLHRCRILAAACVLVVAGLSEAAAQFPPVPGQAPGQAASGSAFPPPGAQQSSAFPPPPGQAPAQRQDSAFPPPPGQSQGAAPGGFSPAQPGGFGGGGPGPSEAQKVCLNFPSLREDVEKGAAVIRAASGRKASREEVCPLFKSFAAKESKMISFLETNQKVCGVPPKIITQARRPGRR